MQELQRHFLVMYQNRLIGYTSVELTTPIWPNAVNGEVVSVHDKKFSRIQVKEITKAQFVYLHLTNVPELKACSVRYLSGGHGAIPIIGFKSEDIIGKEIHVDFLSKEIWFDIGKMLKNKPCVQYFELCVGEIPT